MKIVSSQVLNMKAVSSITMDFKGCTAIVTGKNNSGKTTALWALAQRIQGIKPDEVLKRDEKEGFAEYTFTSGEKIRWEVKEGGKEKLIYITDKGIKTTATRAICDRFFPATFNVDEFLSAQPAKQRKTLQELAGLDFTDIDTRYKSAFEERTAANTLAGNAKTIFDAAAVAPKVDVIKMEELQARKEKIRTDMTILYRANQAINAETRERYAGECKRIDNEVSDHNKKQSDLSIDYNACFDALSILKLKGYKGSEVDLFLDKIKSEMNPVKVASLLYPKQPTDLSIQDEEYTASECEQVLIKELPDDTALKAIDQEIIDATETNRKAGLYKSWLELQSKRDLAQQIAKDADIKVKAIEQERMDLIKTAKMPEGFSFTDDGINYNGFAFNREQLSYSAIYIAALKLASMKKGDVDTFHFDASPLDNVSLKEVQVWAEGLGYQLLVERPDLQGGEIQYQLITE